MSILRLPEDIFCKIFAFAGPTSFSPDNDSADLLPSHFNTISPNNVSVVCRRWREIALNDPILWSTIYISLRYPSEDELKKAIIHLEQCLERSRNIPLSCFVAGAIKYDSPSKYLTNLLFCSLFEQQHRWRAVEINILGYYGGLDGSPYFVLRTDDLRLLQSFSTNYPRMYHIPGPGNLSSLTSLELDLVMHPSTNMWLIHAPNLEKLVMTGLTPRLSGAWRIPTIPITLRRLRTLHYDARLSGLQILDCPALEDFTILRVYVQMISEVHHYHNFLTRNPPSRALLIQDIHSMSREHFRDFFPSSKSEIKSLSLSFSTPNFPLAECALFEMLMEKHAISSSDHPGRFMFAHELEHLEVVGAESTIEIVLNFLIARWTMNDRKLASVKLKRCSDYVRNRDFAEIVADTGALPVAWSQVKTFIEEGLVLEIS